MFRASSWTGVKFFLVAIISIGAIFFDQRSAYFHHYRDKISVIILPLQILVDAPIHFVRTIVIGSLEQKHFIQENAHLRAQQLLLESRLQRLLALEQENTQLHELLQSTPQIAGKVVVAQLLAVALDPALQQVIVDKGERDHIYVGQPVLDAYGVLGQVINIGVLTSKVLLLTDSHSAVPVQDYRNGVRAIALGMGSIDKLSVINVPDTADIRKGDLFVTSGLGMRFPVGYPVGVVSQFNYASGDRFVKIMLTPTSHLDQSQQVLLVWPDKAELSDEVKQLLDKPLPAVN